MTVQESADALRADLAVRVVVDYDDYLDEPRCPLCAGVLSEAGTPTLESGMIDHVVDLPVFAWHCDCRRSGVDVIATAEHAPEGYVPIPATIDGRDVTVGVPEPAIQEVDDDF